MIICGEIARKDFYNDGLTLNLAWAVDRSFATTVMTTVKNRGSTIFRSILTCRMAAICSDALIIWKDVCIFCNLCNVSKDVRSWPDATVEINCMSNAVPTRDFEIGDPYQVWNGLLPRGVIAIFKISCSSFSVFSTF